MAVPKFFSFFVPMLKVLNENSPMKVKALRETVADQMNLTQLDKSEMESRRDKEMEDIKAAFANDNDDLSFSSYVDYYGHNFDDLKEDFENGLESIKDYTEDKWQDFMDLLK